jgi:hypothetical protein
LVIVICGYIFGWKWTGLPKRTLWDWLKLLIVPAALALGVFWLNRAQERERQAHEDRTQRERDVETAQREQEREATEEARRKRDLEVAEQRAQDEALQAYLDKMTDLLVVHKLSMRRLLKHKPQGYPVRTVAWARTKTALRRLDGNRKGAVLRFLTEADLITKDRPVIRSLSGADLVDAKLEGSVLRNTALQGVHLNCADLTQADLSGTDLSGADLSGAKLSGAKLMGADLINAIVTEGQLDQAHSLTGATMPDGQPLKSADNPDGPTFEDWLKSREGRGG